MRLQRWLHRQSDCCTRPRTWVQILSVHIEPRRGGKLLITPVLGWRGQVDSWTSLPPSASWIPWASDSRRESWRALMEDTNFWPVPSNEFHTPHRICIYTTSTPGICALRGKITYWFLFHPQMLRYGIHGGLIWFISSVCQHSEVESKFQKPGLKRKEPKMCAMAEQPHIANNSLRPVLL